MPASLIAKAYGLVAPALVYALPFPHDFMTHPARMAKEPLFTPVRLDAAKRCPSPRDPSVKDDGVEQVARRWQPAHAGLACSHFILRCHHLDSP